jgi:hypothetical protein
MERLKVYAATSASADVGRHVIAALPMAATTPVAAILSLEHDAR